MKKQTKVLVAAAMLTLGASFSSFALVKNATWVQTEEGWKVYDNKEEDYVAEDWFLYNGKEYWIDEDGYLGCNVWVEDPEVDGRWYYAQVDGTKTISDWQYVYPAEDDEAEEESWYYFDTKGRMVANKTVSYKDNTYYFGGDGAMLTGWIQKDVAADESVSYKAAEEDTAAGSIYYLNEDGALQKELWLEDFGWGVDSSELYDDSLNWYWINANGKPQTGKKAIDGLTYFFNAEAEMMTGWIGEFYTGADATYFAEIDENTAINSTTIKYAYLTNDTGYMAVSEWEKVNAPDDDDNKNWFWFDKNGRAFIPAIATTATPANAVDFTNGDNNSIAIDASETIAFAEKRIDGATYLFNARGEMLTGLLGLDGKIYYYGKADQGTMQTGAQVIADADGYEFDFYFATKNSSNGYTKGAAVTGNANGYLYNNGQLMTSGEAGLYKVVTTTAGQFVVDNEGEIQHSKSKKYELVDENDGINDGNVYKFTYKDLKDAYEDSIATMVKQ